MKHFFFEKNSNLRFFFYLNANIFWWFLATVNYWYVDLRLTFIISIFRGIFLSLVLVLKFYICLLYKYCMVGGLAVRKWETWLNALANVLLFFLRFCFLWHFFCLQIFCFFFVNFGFFLAFNA